MIGSVLLNKVLKSRLLSGYTNEVVFTKYPKSYPGLSGKFLVKINYNR